MLPNFSKLSASHAATNPPAQTRLNAVLSEGLMKNVKFGVAPGKRAWSAASSDLDVAEAVKQIIESIPKRNQSAANAANDANDAKLAADEVIEKEDEELSVRVESITNARALARLYFEDIGQSIQRLRLGDSTIETLYRDHLKAQLLTLPVENMQYYKMDELHLVSNIPVITSVSNIVMPPEPKMVKNVSPAGGMPTYELIETKSEYAGGQWQVSVSGTWFYWLGGPGPQPDDDVLPQLRGYRHGLWRPDDDDDESRYR